MEKTYTCIVCPMGCRVSVSEQGDNLIISGYECKNGRIYATNEYTAPKRMITSTVSIDDGVLRRLPVVSNMEVPKGLIRDCLKVMNSTVAIAPVRLGDVVVRDICNSGVDIVASRDIDKQME